MNNVSLLGRLTKDPELKYTNNGTAVATFTLAIDRPYTNAQGEKKTDFIQCVMWRKPAEVFVNHHRKGDQAAIVGSIQTRNYENNQGQRVYVTEVVADSFTFIGSKKDNGQQSQTGQTQQTGFFGAGTTQSNDFGNNSKIEIDEDDLPF